MIMSVVLYNEMTISELLLYFFTGKIAIHKQV